MLTNGDMFKEALEKMKWNTKWDTVFASDFLVTDETSYEVTSSQNETIHKSYSDLL